MLDMISCRPSYPSPSLLLSLPESALNNVVDLSLNLLEGREALNRMFQVACTS